MSTQRFESAVLTRQPSSTERANHALAATASAFPSFHEDAPEDTHPGSILLGDSLAIRRLRSQVQRIAPYFRTALIRGEIGAGKQHVARAIHARSPAADGPFIVSSAAALAEASSTNQLLESAHGGTLFLEGVGELPYANQAGLLRFLRACETRAGASRAEPGRPNIRILAATHRDLRTLSAIGQFRQDLYASLSAVEIVVPPLRQRAQDVAVLSAWLLRRLAHRTGQTPKTLAHATLAQLESRLWPKNLRELERVLAHAAVLADGHTIEPRHLLSLVEHANSHAAAPTPKLERLQEVIHHHVLEVLTRCGGNKLRAAELLGISRSTLYRMIETASLPE